MGKNKKSSDEKIYRNLKNITNINSCFNCDFYRKLHVFYFYV